MSTAEDTLEWFGNFEWEHSQIRDRHGVVTKNYGGPRSADEIRLGIDYDYGAPAGLTHYWPLEDDPSTTSTRDVTDNFAPAYWEGNPVPADRGAVGSNAPHFSPGGSIQAVNFSDNADFDHGGEFTFACFFETNDDRNLRTLFHNARPFDTDGSILISKNEGPRIAVGIHHNGSWHFEDDFHLGEMELGTPYLLLVRLRQVGGEWRLGVNLNNQEEERVLDFERQALPSENNFGALGALWYAGSRDMGGTFDEVMYWDYGLTNNEKQDVWRAFIHGWLLTRWKSTDGRAYELVVSHNTPSETNPYINVVQDTSGNGSPDNFQTVPIESDKGVYQLDGFEDTSSNYSLEFVLRTDDPYVTPTFEYALLNIEQEPPVGIWATGDDAVVDTDSSEGVILTE